MEILTGILVAILSLILIILIKLSTTFFHEMGHAIPAMIFTKKSVKVYIGSYGDISKTTHFNLGRLTIYFKWNLLDWKMGMCSHEEIPQKIWQTVLVILGGPIASLLISIPLLLNLRSIQDNQILFFISIVFIAAAFYDFFINMIPTSTPFKMHDGSEIYCDGYALYNIAQRKTAPPEYFVMEKMFKAKKYEAIISMGEELLAIQPDQRFVYDFMIQSQVQLQNIDDAIESYNLLNHHLKLMDHDYFEIGKLYRINGNNRDALKCFNHYRFKNFQNVDLLNEIAITQLELSDNEDAIETADALLSIDQKNLAGYITRAHAYIHVAEYDLAKADLEFVFSKSKTEPQGNFVYGLLHEKLNDDQLALHYYEKAKILNCNQHGLDFRIASVRTI